MKTQIVLEEGAGAETVRKQQTGRPAENEGIIAIRYPRCPGLARAINSTYMVSWLEAIGEITYIHCRRSYPDLDRIQVLVFSNLICKEGKAKMSDSQKQRQCWEEGDAAARLTTAQNSGHILGIPKDDRASYWTDLLLLSWISSGVFSYLFSILFTGRLIWILIYKNLGFCLVGFLVIKPVCEVEQVDSGETKDTPSFCQQWDQLKERSWEPLSNLCPSICMGDPREA